MGLTREQLAMLREYLAPAGKRVLAAGMHTAAIDASGRLYSTGHNQYGQSALRDRTAYWNGSSIRDQNITALAAGMYYTVCLRADGTAAGYGEHVKDLNWTGITAISSGENHILGLKKDGTVLVSGMSHSDSSEVSTWSDIVEIAAGRQHSLGLRSDGTVLAAGREHIRYGSGKVEYPVYESSRCDVSSWREICRIAADDNRSFGIRRDGTVAAAGIDYYGDKAQIDTWTDIVALGLSSSHVLGLKGDGTVAAAGFSYSGQCDTQEWTDVVAVAADHFHSYGLRADGTVLHAGPPHHDLSHWRDVIAIFPDGQNLFGLRCDGTLLVSGDSNRFHQCNVEDWKLYSVCLKSLEINVLYRTAIDELLAEVFEPSHEERSLS